MLISTLLTFSFIIAQPEKASADARAWVAREAVVKDLSQKLSKTLSRNFRAVRRGNPNARVAGLVQEAVQQANRRIKRDGAYLLMSENGGPSEKKWTIVAHEIDQALGNMDPYRREFAESCLVDRKIAGNLLAGKALRLVEIPESLENRTVLDLEKFERTGDRSFDRLINDLMSRSGSKFYALILPKVILPDASYSASDNFTVEQTRDGNINVFQERRRPAKSDVLSVQVISEAPRNILFIGKNDLEKEITDKTVVKSFVIDTFGDVKTELISSAESDEEQPPPPAEEEAPGSRHRRFDVKSE